MNDRTAIFQSPFSGDFLCFEAMKLGVKEGIDGLSISIFRRLSLFRTFKRQLRCMGHPAFNLHFQETFFVSKRRLWKRYKSKWLSISIFRRLSLFLIRSLNLCYRNITSFNLHFQETFFVSLKEGKTIGEAMIDFQSPFSGDFLCFHINTWMKQAVAKSLSISIFRRLSLFRKRSRLPTTSLIWNRLSISIFRRLSLFP